MYFATRSSTGLCHRRLVHPSQSQRSFQKLFQSLHACISKQFIYVGWAGVDAPCPDFYNVEFFLMEMEIHSINQMEVQKVWSPYKGFECLWVQLAVEGTSLRGRLGPLSLGMLQGGFRNIIAECRSE